MLRTHMYVCVHTCVCIRVCVCTHICAQQRSARLKSLGHHASRPGLRFQCHHQSHVALGEYPPVSGEDKNRGKAVGQLWRLALGHEAPVGTVVTTNQ